MASSKKSSHSRFDAGYYRRFYEDTRSRVTDSKEISRLAAFVCHYLKYIGQPVEKVLDMGCGLGLWQREIKKHFPRAAYTGVEYSPYLCEKLGWQQGSAVDFKSRSKFDLVICQGVLQYLPSPEARRAMENLKRLCRGVLYLEVLTKKDWAESADQTLTDGDVYLRSGHWYQGQLQGFKNLGGGLWLSPKAPVVLYEMEAG